MRIYATLSLGVLCCACGSKSAPPGMHFNFTSVAFGTSENVSFDPNGNLIGSSLTLVFSDNGNVCTQLSSNDLAPNTNYLVALIAQTSKKSDPVSPGTYNIINPHVNGTAVAMALNPGFATCQVVAENAECNDTFAADGFCVGGNINFASISETTGASGTYDFVVGSQAESISNTFTATFCPGLVVAQTAISGAITFDTSVNPLLDPNSSLCTQSVAN